MSGFGLVFHTCGHQTPVRGDDRHSSAPCSLCAPGRATRPVPVYWFFPKFGQHPGAYCPCEQCQAAIP